MNTGRADHIGVIVAGVFWEILQVVGGYYIGHVLRHSTSTYGVFAWDEAREEREGLVFSLGALGEAIFIYGTCRDRDGVRTRR